MSKEMWSQVNRFSNGDSLDADTLNVPIGQLSDRTTYLYNRIRDLGGNFSSVLLMDAPLEDGVAPGSAVCLDAATGRFRAAIASMALYDDFTAADSAFTVGMLQSRSGERGTVVVYGSLDLGQMAADDVLERGEAFRRGRYYLSSSEAGRLTSSPRGPVICVCSIDGELADGGFTGRAMVSPQYLDMGTSHVHRTAVLEARPAGTLSEKGYLPLDETHTDAQKGPLALRFGGTWTSDSKVDYSFFLGNETANWLNGLELKWREDGGAETHSVPIPAPDVEVPLSNGLTVRLSLPASDSDKAYSGLSAGQRTWETLTFPDAGRGWLGHEPAAVAESASVEGLKVAVRGSPDASPMPVSVAFPGSAQILTLGKISAGSTFAYGGRTYEFTEDVDSYPGRNAPVSLGTCQADSALYLARALNEASGGGAGGGAGADGGTFAVFEGDAGLVQMVAMEASAIPEKGIVASVSSKSGSGFDTVGEGERAAVAVAFDGNLRVLGGNAVAENVVPQAWNDIGRGFYLMPYRDTSDAVTVPAGTVASGTLADDEPGAVYDYALGLDRTVARYWPPVPPKSAALMVNGVEMDNKALVPDSPTVSFGRDTIHWFTGRTGRKPWPEAFTRRGAAIDPSEDKAEILHWVRGFQGATGPVTSIQARPGSPIRVVGYGTDDAANTGDLEVSAELDFTIVGGGAPGYMVPKRSSNGRLIAGPVVERIVGGAGVSVLSRAGCPDGQGTVVVALGNGAYRNAFSDVALENAEQAKIGMFPYVRLKGYSGASIASPSAFTATMRVPENLPDGNYALRVFGSVFGEAGFSGAQSRRVAAVRLSYDILPDFSAEGAMRYRNLKTSLLKARDRPVYVPLGHVVDGSSFAYNGFDPVFATTDDDSMADADDVVAKVFGRSIPDAGDFMDAVPELRPGYLVGVRIARAATPSEQGQPYTAPLGFIGLSWQLVTAE